MEQGKSLLSGQPNLRRIQRAWMARNNGGGLTRNSDETSVMGVERRG